MIIVPTNIPPALSSGDQYWPSTVALLTGEGPNNSTIVVDRSAVGANWVAQGTLKVSTAQSKWGGSSLQFDGNGYITASSPSTNFNLPADFTVEGWVRPSQLSGLITDFRNGTYFEIGMNTSRFYFNTPGSSTFNYFSTTLTANTWYHFAVSRSGGVIRGFCNGVLGSSVANTTNITAGGNRPIIGADGNNQAWAPSKLYGFIDDYRVTKGVGRYVGNFVPPEQLPTAV